MGLAVGVDATVAVGVGLDVGVDETVGVALAVGVAPVLLTVTLIVELPIGVVPPYA